MKKWEIRLNNMSDDDKKYLITGIEDGWISPTNDDLHIYIYNKLKDIDEHPILTFIKRLFLSNNSDR